MNQTPIVNTNVQQQVQAPAQQVQTINQNPIPNSVNQKPVQNTNQIPVNNGVVQQPTQMPVQQVQTPFTQVAPQHIIPDATIPIPNENPV